MPRAVPRVTIHPMRGYGLEALPPPQIAQRAREVGASKTRQPLTSTLVLAGLAGAFIAIGAVFSTTVLADGGALPYGVARLLAGLVFSLGLVLVVVAGAELFTGDNLVVIAWASRQVSTARLCWIWLIVYVGNFAGAMATAALLYAARQYTFGHGAVGEAALQTAVAKTGLGFGQAVALGALCNALVCIAVWMSYGARSLTDRVLAVIPPIAAFVAAGFEHSVANMYFVPEGLMIKHDGAFVASVGPVPGLGHLTWSQFLTGNLVPVTIGNIAGGALMVGAVYWFVYLRPRAE
jgi:formate/nitrite transporter